MTNLILIGIIITIIGIVISIIGSTFLIKKTKDNKVFHKNIIIADDTYIEFNNSSIDLYNKIRLMNSNMGHTHVPVQVVKKENIFETSGVYAC